MRFISKKRVAALLICGIVGIGFVLYADQKVDNAAQTRLWPSAKQIPFNPVGLVPGTRPGGVYFRNRIEAAAELYWAGKVKWIIVSGDNRRMHYNEPHEMQKALMKKGVPKSAIYCDYAGFTTLDSVARAREVFGQQRITVISQQFQNQRAIYLAQHYGIDAVGLNAEDVPADQQRRLGTIREYIARARAVLDAMLLRRQPHFTGPTITPGDESVTSCSAS